RRLDAMDPTSPNCYVFICQERDGAVIPLEGERPAGEFGMDIGVRIKEKERGIRLDQVDTVRIKGGYFRDAKLYLTFWGHPGEGLSIRGTCSADAERLEAIVNQLLTTQSWRASPSYEPLGGRIGGIGRLLQRREKQMEEDNRNVNEGLADLRSLQASASDLVQLARRLQRDDKDDPTQVRSLLEEYGLATDDNGTMVTPAATYQHVIQLCCTALTKGSKSCGIMLLQDAYCLVNRALGFDLISPRTLLQCLKAEAARSDRRLTIRQFRDGAFLAVALPNFSTEEACKRLRDEVLPTWHDSVGALELADTWKISPSLATILLTEATTLGVLAADVSIEGDRWQRNLFTDCVLLPLCFYTSPSIVLLDKYQWEAMKEGHLDLAGGISFVRIPRTAGSCNSKLTKDEYGVKTFEGRSYLFGPGVKDHINGQGFGQMGMGDYDMRLRSYCIMFVEHFDDTVLYNEFRENDEEFRLRQLSEVHEVAVMWLPQAPALLPDRIEIWTSMDLHGSTSNDWGRFAGITVGSGRTGLLLTGLATTKALRMLLWKDSQQPVGLQWVTILGFPLPTHLTPRRGAKKREDRVEKEKRTEKLVERTGTREPPPDEDISLDKVAREVSSAMVEVRRSLENLPELPDIRPVGTQRMRTSNQECEKDP
ncbi:Surfeit locus protein 2, partial [Perkinsus olseni]